MGEIHYLTAGAEPQQGNGQGGGSSPPAGAPANAEYLLAGDHGDLTSAVVVSAAGLALVVAETALAQRTALGAAASSHTHAVSDLSDLATAAISCTSLTAPTVAATFILVSPWVAGGTSSGGNLLVESTTHATKGDIRLTSQVRLPEQSAPSTPASGFVYVYAKSDGLLYSKDDAGTESLLGPTAGAYGTTVSGTAVAVSLSSAEDDLGSDNSITSTAFGTLTDTPSISLAAGTWLVQMHATIQAIPTTTNGVIVQVYNDTDAAAVSGSQARVGTLTGSRVEASASWSGIVTVASAKTFVVQAAKVNTNAGTYNVLATGSSGVTRLVAVRLL